jgi:signal transduction histidine kinase
LQLVNPALRVMLGCDQQTFVERYSANELLALPQGIEHGEVMLQWLRHADNGVEIELCSRAGLSVPVLVNRTPIWDERGELRYIFAFYTNIAQQKAIEHALTRAKEAAEAANLAKSSFLASMSHELRTPMHAILSYSDLGLEKAEGEEQEKLRRYYQRINVSGKRLLGLINDLLDLAKLEAGKMSYELAPHNLQVLVDDALAEIRPLMESKQLRLQFQPDERSISLICDRNRILQVLVNLLGNAVKFTPPGMCIYLGFLHDEPMRGGGIGSGIRLRDEGPGIASDELESIFEKFIQGSSTHKQGGTGLGLAICRDIVRDHGGEVYASNDAAGGAVFTLLLPCEN